jgi:hypothetical protein
VARAEHQVIERVRRRSLLALLATWKPLREKFPDVDEKLRVENWLD